MIQVDLQEISAWRGKRCWPAIGLSKGGMHVTESGKGVELWLFAVYRVHMGKCKSQKTFVKVC